jgi:hypothetical protein
MVGYNMDLLAVEPIDHPKHGIAEADGALKNCFEHWFDAAW